MSSVWSSAASIIAVAALWGCTNPLLSRGSQGMEKQAQRGSGNASGARGAPASIAHRIARETLFLISNWRFVLPFIVNQCGSALFLYTLSHGELSLVVPLTNILSVVFTICTSILMGEEKDRQAAASPSLWLGVAMIAAGTGICIASKQTP